MADLGGGQGATPPLFLNQTEARRAKKLFWETRPPLPPPLCKGLDDQAPPPLSQGLDPALAMYTLQHYRGVSMANIPANCMKPCSDYLNSWH